VTAGGDQPADTGHDAHYIAARFVALLGATTVHTGAEAAGYAIDGRAPAVALLPRDPAQVADALALATELQLAVAPWGGGTQMATGYPLKRLDVVLSLAHFTNVILPPNDAHVVTVQAGTTLAEANVALAPYGRFLPLDGPLMERATIGGRLSAGSLGLRRARYGNPRDLLENLIIARSDGMLMHTGGTHNRAMQYQALGYDLNKVFVGALGTLGIILQAQLRTAPLPESEATVIAAFDEPGSIWGVLDDLAVVEFQPAASVACSAGTLGAERGLTTEQADEIEPGAHPLLLVRLAGAPVDVRRQALTVRSLMLKYGASHPLLLHGPAMLPPWQALDDLPATADLLPTEAVIKVSALPSELDTVVDAARALSAEHGLRLCWLADTLTGLLWLRINSDADGEMFSAALIGLQDALARRWRNAIVLGCAPELRRQLPLWGADPQGVELLRAVKGRLDPPGTLNPGRFGGK
jgi:FAD/FMN-containing dehydrogenase